jgi:hypothetical protein
VWNSIVSSFVARVLTRWRIVAHPSQVVVGGNGSVNEDKFSLSVRAPFAGDGSVTLNAKPNYRPCTYCIVYDRRRVFVVVVLRSMMSRVTDPG